MLLLPPLPGKKLSVVQLQYEACGNSSEPGSVPHASTRYFIAIAEIVSSILITKSPQATHGESRRHCRS